MDPALIVILSAIALIFIVTVGKLTKDTTKPTPNHLKHIHERLSTASYNSETSSPMEVIQEVLEYIENNAKL